MRNTIGSQDTVLPSERDELVHLYNRLNKPLTEEELTHNSNPSILTVAARAVQKHAARQSPNAAYWLGNSSMDGMTEEDKNIKAQQIINRIIEQCQWVNIHTLNPNSHVFILEIRDAHGFGARWEIQHQFRGLVEPQLQFMNLKK